LCHKNNAFCGIIYYINSMKNLVPIFLLLPFALFYSCSSESVKSSENFIVKFEIEGAAPIIKDSQNEIYIWIEKSGYETLKSKSPRVEVSENAKLEKVGEEWFEGYRVTAENGDKREYSIEIDTIVPKLYSFETWNSTLGYYVPTASNSRWTSGNAGISLALLMLNRDNKNPKNYPTRDTVDIYGNAVLMETIEGGDVFGRKIYLISGNLVLGNFNSATAITDELMATELGHVYTAKPKSVKGYYKYKEGPGVFENNGVPEPGRGDICSMNAFFYQSDLDGRDTTLTVKNIEESDLVIATARMSNCVETDGGDFKLFKLDFDYTAEPDFANHRYKLAMTFAASRDGDKYAGKIGSKLTVDEVEFEDY
jgi:hypothetical protein